MEKGVDNLLTNERFRRYVLNPNQGDSDYWDNWKKEHIENIDLFNQAKSLIIDFYEPLSSEEFQTEAIAFKRKIDVTNADKNDIIKLYDQRRNNRNPWFFRIAASLLVFVSVALVANWYFTNNKKQEVAIYDATKVTIKKKVGKGQKLTITFQDGTRVKLNSESYITYPEKFSDSIREVTLSGEAYFDIAHFDDWPFIVKSRNVNIKVLGTSFNVSSYPEESCVKVALVDGKIEVKAENQNPVKLKRQEMAKVKKDDTEVTNFDVNKIIAWKNNKILFDKATFDEVQSTLERWYNVKFIYKQKPVFDGGYTGEFTDLSLESVLKGMSMDKFNFRIKGNEVYIN